MVIFLLHEWICSEIIIGVMALPQATSSTAIATQTNRSESIVELNIRTCKEPLGKLIVVSNRLPFVLKRNDNGKLSRVAR